MFSLLYVDDEPSLLEVGKLFLERSTNFTVDTAVSAAEAITKLQSQHYDGIISDYQMPDMDGIAFLKYVRTYYECLPFVLFTGRGREEVVIEALNNGADFYIQKGGDPTSQFVELGHKVTVAINKKQTECQLEESQQRINDIVNFLPDATFAINGQGKVIVWNRSIEEMTGIKAGDILGTGNYSYAIPFYGERRPVLIDLVLREDKETEKKYPRIVKQDDKLISENFIPRLNDGNGAYISFTAAPLYDNKGHVAGAIESIRDITELKQVQDEVRNAEERYRTIFENTGTATVLIEENTVISLANEEFERLSGYPRQEIEGKKSWTEFVVKEDLDRMLAQHRLRRERLEAALKHYEFRFVTKSGDIRHIFLTIDVIPGTKKSVASLMDITERKWAEDALKQTNTELHAAYEQLTATEEELRQNYDELSKKEQMLCESEEKYRTIFENAGDAIAIHDLEGHFVEVNEVICRRFGYTRDEMLKMRAGDVDDPVHAREVGERIVELTKKGHVIFETVHITRDGRQIPTEVSAVLFHLGNKPLVMSIARDITERKQAEEQVRQFAEELDQIFQTAADGMRVVDRDFNVLQMNGTFLKLAGICREDAAGRKCYEVFPGPRCHTPGCPLTRILGGEAQVTDEIEKERRDGSRVPCIVTATPFRHPDGELIGIVEDFRDITERKRAEEALQKRHDDLEAAHEEITATEEELRQNYDELSKKEQALCESERKYRDLVELLPQTVFELDERGFIASINKTGLKTFGITDEDLERGIDAIQGFVSGDRDRIRENIQRVLSGESLGGIEYTAIRKDGTTFPVIIYADAILHQNTPAGIRGVLVDITEIKRADEELKRKQREMAAVLKGLRGVAVEYLDPSLTILWANEVMAEEFGIPLSDVRGKRCYEMIHNRNERCPDCPVCISIRIGDISEKEVTLPDGRVFLVRCNPVMDEKGSVAGVVHAMINITEHKQAEEALKQKNTELHAAYEQLTAGDEELRQSFDELSKKELMCRENENNLKAILESLQSALVIIDSKTHTIVNANSVAIRMIGAPREEIIGHVCHKYICPADVGKCPISDLKQTIDLSERILLTAKGEQVPILKSVTPKVISGHEYFIENIIDITERKRMETALREVNNKLNLLSSITRHDIRNQLLSLTAYLELSKETLGDAAKTLEYIIKEERAANAIEQQIIFTKEYQDLGVRAPVWQNVSSCLKLAVGALTMRDIRIVDDIADLEIYVDPLFEKVFYNLIDNALRYGGTDMTTILFGHRASGQDMIISVEDNGVGIMADDKKRLFERGFGHHTGLGLFLSREILSITGITITETGEPGEGARFEITVPKGMYRFGGVR